MNDASDNLPIKPIFGMPLCAMRMGEVVNLVDQTISARSRLLIGVVNAAKVVNMRHDPKLDAAVRAANVIFADGISVVWASRVLRKSLPERVAGIDLMHEMLKLASKKKYRVYCFGAREEVVQKVVAKIEEDYPGAVIAGYCNGYYKEEEEPKIAKQIAETKPDMLFVAMSPPKKEIFLAKHAEVLGVHVMHGVGGAFDVMAGRTKRAPVLWQKLGLEWLFRIVQEPRRMWRRYLITNTLFLGMLIREIFSSGKPSNA